jgi:hypothetical protein
MKNTKLKRSWVYSTLSYRLAAPELISAWQKFSKEKTTWELNVFVF